MQDSSGGNMQGRVNESYELLRAGALSATSGTSSPPNAKKDSRKRGSRNINEVLLSSTDPASDAGHDQVAFSDKIVNLVIPQTQNNSDAIDTNGEDIEFNATMLSDPLQLLPAPSSSKSAKCSSRQSSTSTARDELILFHDLPLTSPPSAKSFNTSGKETRLSENDSTWNSHRHVDIDSISMETNIGDEIIEDLDLEEDADDDTTVLEELKISVILPGDSVEENKRSSLSANTIETSNQEIMNGQTEQLLETTSGTQSRFECLSINSSCSSPNVQMLSNSTPLGNAGSRSVVLDDLIAIENEAIERRALLDDLIDTPNESVGNADNNNETVDMTFPREWGGSEQYPSQQQNQEPELSSNVHQSIIPSSVNDDNFEPNDLMSHSMREQGDVSSVKRRESLRDNLTVELSRSSRQRSSSTNSQNANISRISVQSLEGDDDLDTQSGAQSPEDNGQQTSSEGLQLPSDQCPQRQPSSRAGRLHAASERPTALEPIPEPASRIPSPLTLSPRGAENVLLGASTGHLYSPSGSPLRTAASTHQRIDSSVSTNRLATSLDELSMLRVHGTLAESHGTLGESSSRRQMSIVYGHRPLSTRRNSAHRPGSTLNSRPRSTNVCRARSGRHSWPALKRPSSDVFHLPPSGPDCLPGCGYSGLPCYVCSSKRVQEQNKLRESSSLRHFGLEFPIWTIFRYGSHRGSRVDPHPFPVGEQPRRGRDRGRNSGPPPSYTSLFPETTCLGLRECCSKCRHSRLTTMVLLVLLVVSVIYVLIVAGHFERRM